MLHIKSYNDGSYVVLMGLNQMLLISENLHHNYKHGFTLAQVWYMPVCSRPPVNQVSGSIHLFFPESSHESYEQ